MRTKRQFISLGFLSIFALFLIGYSSPVYAESVQISLVDNKYNTPERIAIINDVLFSNHTREIADNIMHKGSSNNFSTYYYGWQAALNGTIPLEFNVSKTPVGDIIINFNNYKHPKGMAGFTKFQGSTAIIDIYSIENLNHPELQMLLRHELGHAFGLGHSSNKADLMYYIIPYYSAFISVENANKIIKNYVIS